MSESWPARWSSPESCETPRLRPVKSFSNATRAIWRGPSRDACTLQDAFERCQREMAGGRHAEAGGAVPAFPAAMSAPMPRGHVDIGADGRDGRPEHVAPFQESPHRVALPVNE